MTKRSAITVRLPDVVKERLEARAKSEHRSLSAQVLADLESAVATTPTATRGRGRFLGLYAESKLPTDRDIAEVRGQLWGRLGRDV